MPEREISLRFLAQPTDVNFGGNVHGGTAMKWLDQAGYVCASAWSGRYCVTAFVGEISFHSPIKVGDLVELKAKVIHTGRSSMHIKIDLHASNLKQCNLSQAIECFMIFVAVDEDGKSVPVPAWEPESKEDKELQAYAKLTAQQRKDNQKP